MYTLTVYDSKTKLLSLSSNSFNHTLRKQDDGSYTSIRIPTDGKDAVEASNILASKLNTPVTIIVYEDSKQLIQLQGKILSDISIDGFNQNTGITLNLKD